MAYTISSRPLDARDIRNEVVASMEQVIGTALSAIVGIMLPLMQLATHQELSSFLQGMIGAIGLIGIGFGSVIIGRLSDAHGYLFYFRLCPIIIMAGALFCFFFANVPCLMLGLFIAGFGVGGGYSLDSAYISELMPKRWSDIMVGIAKSSCSLGFVLAALLAVAILKIWQRPQVWNSLILIIAVLSAITFLMRIRWAESPKWLLIHKNKEMAQKAADMLLGENVEICSDVPPQESGEEVSWHDLLKGTNLVKVIFSGVPWACEGLAVYGFGVFLPVMVMALGLESVSSAGIDKVLKSVETTAVVNCFMIPGFVLGLLMMRKLNQVKMLYWGFLLSAVGLGILLWAFLAKLPVWVSLCGFLVFEVALNFGPHLLTYIIPSYIYPVADRGVGSGIAAMLGKVGAVLGVIIMPVLLQWGGMSLVLIVSIAVMVIGALVGKICGKILKLV